MVAETVSKLAPATVIEVWFSGYDDNREVQRQIYFGYVDGGAAAPKERHEVTNRVPRRSVLIESSPEEQTIIACLPMGRGREAKAVR